MYEVRVETRLQASHRCGPAGDPAPEHEHEWRVAVRARSGTLNRMAIVIDFRRLRQATDAVLAPLQGSVLEDQRPFADEPPTAPVLAAWVHEQLVAELGSADCQLVAVEVEADRGMTFEYAPAPVARP